MYYYNESRRQVIVRGNEVKKSLCVGRSLVKRKEGRASEPKQKRKKTFTNNHHHKVEEARHQAEVDTSMNESIDWGSFVEMMVF